MVMLIRSSRSPPRSPRKPLHAAPRRTALRRAGPRRAARTGQKYLSRKSIRSVITVMRTMIIFIDPLRYSMVLVSSLLPPLMFLEASTTLLYTVSICACCCRIVVVNRWFSCDISSTLRSVLRVASRSCRPGGGAGRAGAHQSPATRTARRGAKRARARRTAAVTRLPGLRT